MPIKVDHLTHEYNPGTSIAQKAVDDVSFEIKDGEFIGLIGHTGSGKSTLIQHLNALIKPTSGKVYLDGEDINADKSKLKSVRKRVGLVFQYPEYQLFEMSVLKDVCFGPTNLGLSEDEIDKAAKEALNLVGIDESYYEMSPFELSGGEKRRVAIAGILAMKPQILVLDEPAAGVDPRGRNEILEAIKKMHDETGITVIMVSHSMEDVAKYADRILVMDKGRLAMEGTPSEVFSKVDELEKIGLAAPEVSYIMRGISKKFDVPKDIFTVEKAVDAIYKVLKGDSK